MMSSSQARISTTSWAALLGARYPIIQSPMAGVSHTGLMASRAIEAGAIGSIGAANLKDPDTLREEIRFVRRHLSHNQNASNVACLNVNLQQYGEFAVSAPPEVSSSSNPEQSFDVVTTFRKYSQKWLDSARQYEHDQILSKMLKLNPTSATFQRDLEMYQSQLDKQSFDEFAARYGKEAFEKKYYKMIEVILQERPAMFTTIFGFIEPQLLRVMHRYGIAVGATTTCFVTAEDLEAIEKEEKEKILQQAQQQANDTTANEEEELVEFTPSLLKKEKNTISKEPKKVNLLAPPTEAAIHFESGVDFLFLQSTHAGGHQGTVSAPLPIPHPQNCKTTTINGKEVFSSFTDPIIEQTDPTRTHNENQHPVEAMVDLRRSFTRQISRNLEESIARRRAVRASCPFPEGHPFSKGFDEKRSNFLDQNCFLIGCGGISTGKDVAQVMNGAQMHGASIGSRFLLAQESRMSDLHKFGLKKAAGLVSNESEGNKTSASPLDDNTTTPENKKTANVVFSRAFGGRWARVVETKAIRDLDERNHVERVLPFPLQQGVTGKRRAMYQDVYDEIEPDVEKMSEAAEYLNVYCGSKTFDYLDKDEGRRTDEIMKEICDEFSQEFIKSKIEGVKK